VQDIVNQQAYRSILRTALTTRPAGKHLPDLQEVVDDCLDLAIEQRVAHNDPNLGEEDLPRDPVRLSGSQRKRLGDHIRTLILAQITTELRSRMALEALGLLAIQYFEPERLPDFEALGRALTPNVQAHCNSSR